MNVGAIIRDIAPFLSAVFGAVTAAFTILLLMTGRRLQKELDESEPIIDGRPVPQAARSPRRRPERTSQLLRNFIEYVGNVSLTS
jgi:hypothetical protein